MSETAAAPDAKAEDVGNILSMEHVNLTVSDQQTATLFYVLGLGFTRDPFMTVGLTNMWVNVGEQQFHLPTRPAQTIPGHIGLVVPNLDSLQARLSAIEPQLSGTKFAWQRENGHIEVTCPWGNQFRFQGLPDPASGEIVFTLEHEVRSFRHLMYRRPLVNRNPDQTQRDYRPGSDVFV